MDDCNQFIVWWISAGITGWPDHRFIDNVSCNLSPTSGDSVQVLASNVFLKITKPGFTLEFWKFGNAVAPEIIHQSAQEPVNIEDTATSQKSVT